MAIWAEAFFSVMIFGFNQSAAGGVLSFDTFNKQFPRIDTLNTEGSLKAENARIQGMCSFLSYHPFMPPRVFYRRALHGI